MDSGEKRRKGKEGLVGENEFIAEPNNEPTPLSLHCKQLALRFVLFANHLCLPCTLNIC